MISKILTWLAGAAKAVVAAVVTAAVSFLAAGFIHGFDWQALLPALGTAALTAASVYFTSHDAVLRFVSRFIK